MTVVGAEGPGAKIIVVSVVEGTDVGIEVVETGSSDEASVGRLRAAGPMVVLSGGAASTFHEPPDAGDVALSATATMQIAMVTREMATAGRLWANWSSERADIPLWACTIRV